MDVLNRLKNTVTNVLPGNPVTREFEIGQHIASGGPGLLWKIYSGIKKTTKEEVSVWEFEKKLIDRYSRRDKELIIDTFRKGVSQLTRLRHPKIVSVLHPLEESRESLAFATEPVFASLANILGGHENLPSPPPQDLAGHKLYDVEIKYGFLQLSEALSFLHTGVKLVHGNLCPESIIVNKSGAWKVAGFDCCIPNANQQEQAPYYPCTEWAAHLPPVVQPNLNYLAPEHGLQMKCDTSSDMYSLGALFYVVFNSGRPLFDCREQLPSYKKNAKELRNLKSSLLECVPSEAREHVKMLLNAEPSLRPDADQITKITFFEDVGAMTLQYLDSLYQRENLQKSQFFKGLPNVISKLPKRVSLQRILPALMKESVNHDMIPFLLPPILMIAEQASQHEFTKDILPGLVPIFKLQDPIQITYIFLQNMSLLLSKTPQSDIQHHVLPMVYRALEANTAPVQELVLKIIPTFASLIEYSSLKNAIMPRIKKLCLGTGTLSIRVSCLMCLGKLLEYMDKWYVLDDVFPILQQIPSREPAVLMSILGIYKVALSHPKLGITKEVMATKVLPFIFPLCIDSNLNLQQFNAYMGLIKEMTGKVEAEQRSKLEQLNTMQQEQRNLQFTQEPVPDGDTLVTGVQSNKDETMMDKFLSGFGGLFGPSSTGNASASGSTGGVAAAQKTNGTSQKTVNKSTSLESQPAKVGLSMDEKRHLHQHQEYQQRSKTQPVITPQPAISRPAQPQTKPVQPQARDLTASLLSNSNMFRAQPAPTAKTNAFSQPAQPAKPQVDMSAFDNLLPSKPKVAMNQMGSQNPRMQPAQNVGFGVQQPSMMGQQQGMMGQQQGMMGQQQGMMGQSHGMMGQGMMGQPQGMMGQPQGMMGQPQGMMGQPQGMMGSYGGMGNQGMVGMGQNTSAFGSQPMSNMGTMPLTGQLQQRNGTKPLSSQDISDFLG